MSKPTKNRQRQLTRAELKAFEARKSAEEAARSGVELTPTRMQGNRPTAAAARQTTSKQSTSRRIHHLSREQEYSIIRSDFRRLVMILIVLVIALVVMTFFLR